MNHLTRRQYEWRRLDTEQRILKSLREVSVHQKPMSINSFTKKFHISKATLNTYLPNLIEEVYVIRSKVKNKHLLSVTSKGLERLRDLETDIKMKNKKPKIRTVKTGHIYHSGLPAETVDKVVNHWIAIGGLLQNTAPDSFLRIVATAKAPESQE